MLRILVHISNALRVVGIDVRRKLFRTVHQAFGGNLECVVSGGAPISEETIKTLDEFGIQVLNKALRKSLVSNLRGNCAFRSATDAQAHRAKYARLRRELRRAGETHGA